MNATARSLGLTHTRYTDPSGYDDATVATAADQVRLVDQAMRLPVFASIVATPSATLPVAGRTLRPVALALAAMVAVMNVGCGVLPGRPDRRNPCKRG